MAFENIAGYEKEKQILENLQNIYKNVDDYVAKGLRIPRGILLYGAPGVGKTVMARTFAKISENIFELRAADCIDEETSSTNIINAFNSARECDRAVLIIDEIDKIVEESSNFFMESNNNVMKVLLQELDKSEANKNIIIIATANQLDDINPAIIRSGRFDRQINVHNPNMDDRKAIAKYYFGKLSMKNDVDMTYLILATKSYSGAEIECLINEAGILAYESGRNNITDQDIRTIMARMASKSIEQELKVNESTHIVAVHEAGHAVVSFLTARDKTTISASIIPQGDSKGGVYNYEYGGDIALSLDDMKNQIKVGIAGRCAERYILHKLYSGSKSDLTKVYNIAYEMIASLGYAGLRYTMITPRRTFIPVSNKKISLVERQIGILLEECEHEVDEMLKENDLFLNSLVELLEDKHLITYVEISELYKDIKRRNKDNNRVNN